MPLQEHDTTLHPIAQEAFHLLESQGDCWILSAGSAERLSHSLRALPASSELVHAIKSLVALAAHLDRVLRSQQAANTLLQVALSASAAVAEAVEKTVHRRQDRSEQAQARLHGFCQSALSRRARCHGTPPPEGTVTAGSLLRSRAGQRLLSR